MAINFGLLQLKRESVSRSINPRLSSVTVVEKGDSGMVSRSSAKGIRRLFRDETGRRGGSFGALPPEIMENVLRHLVTDDRWQSSRDVANFRLVNRVTRAFVDGHALFKSLHLPSRALRLAEDIYKKVYPQHGLVETLVGGDDRTRVMSGLPVPPARQIAATAPVLWILPEQTGENVINDLRELRDPDGIADAIRALARHSDFGSFNSRDQKFVIDQAVRGFTARGQLETHQRGAYAAALADIHDYIQAGQRFELRRAIAGRPELGIFLWARVSQTRQRENLRGSFEGNDVEGFSGSTGITRHEIKQLQARFENAVGGGRIRRMVKPLAAEYREVVQIQAVAEDLSDTLRKGCRGFDKAHAELERRYSARNRERTDGFSR